MAKAVRLHCSFCGKTETEAGKLVAGPNVYICDVCVATAQRIMAGADGTSATSQPPHSSVWRRLLTRVVRMTQRNVKRRVGLASGAYW